MSKEIKYKFINTSFWVIIGAVIAGFVFTCGHKKPVEKPTVVPPAVIVKEAGRAADPYRRKYDSLLAVVNRLQRENGSVKSDLVKERANRKSAETVLNLALASLDSSQSRERILDVQSAALDFIVDGNRADSISEDLLQNYEHQNILKSEMLELKDSVIQTRDVAIERLSKQNNTLADYSKKLERYGKRKDTGAKVWRSVAAALGGILILKSLK